MIFWGDQNGLPMPRVGWDVFIGEDYKANKHQLKAAFAKLFRWLQEYMSVDTVTLLLPTEDRQHLAVHTTVGLEEEVVQQIRIPIGQGIAGRIAASSEPMIVNDLSAVEVFSPILQQKSLKALVGVPVPIKPATIGVLHVGKLKTHQFTEHDVQQLHLVAHRLKIVIAEVGLFSFGQDIRRSMSWQWLLLNNLTDSMPQLSHC